MPIPDFQSMMLPALKFAASQLEHSLRDAVAYLANQFELTEEERNERLPNAPQPRFYNRVGWARTYLKQAGLLETAGRRSYLKITDRGRQVLNNNPARIDMNFLEQFPEYIEFRERTNENGGTTTVGPVPPVLTPEESIDAAYRKLREDLAKELLDNILRSSPAFFESLVVELLVAMGYGGSGANAARAVGRTGDEGIDGIIDEDKLGLDSIYIQAKRWKDNPVRSEDIQQFIGALTVKRARKGIFITTSRFTDNARAFVSNIDMKVVLIDGKRLADLMIDHGVGVTTANNYEIRKIDTDYFIETLE
jgi:restriction system protein